MNVRAVAACILGLALCLGAGKGTAEAMPAYASSEPLRRYLEAHLGAAERLMAADEAALIREHARETMEAVNTAPWRDALTPELVENYILPVRVAEEPLEPWRTVLRKALKPLLVDAREPLEAALAIRRWMAQRVTPGQSQSWSLGPLGLLRAGAGRCEELGILFVCAARAVGLPARICYTPAWRDADGNHLWVEVWNGAGWSALSVEQPDAAPGTGWFFPHADRTGVILARGFGQAPTRLEAGSVLAGNGRTGFVINRTAAYTTTGTLRVHLVDAKGAPFPAVVQVHVFNSGRPRPVLSTAGKAEAVFALGTGTYLISAADEGKLAFGTATVRRDALTELRLVLISCGEDGLPPLPQGNIRQREGFMPPKRQHPATRPGPQQRPLPPARADWEARLASSDRVYARPTELRREEEAARSVWKKFWGARASASPLQPLFAQYVLSNRIDKEPFSHWRAGLEKKLAGKTTRGDARAAALRVNQWAAALPLHSPQLSSPLPLETIVRRNICGSERDRVAIAVAGLRMLGIPARSVSLGDGFTGEWGAWAEFFDGTAWIPLYPAAPQRMGSLTATPAARRQYAPSVRIELRTAESASPARRSFSGTPWGGAFSEKTPTGNRDWMLCRISPRGTFVPLTQGRSVAGPGMLRIPRGNYVLVQAARDDNGWATWEMTDVRE